MHHRFLSFVGLTAAMCLAASPSIAFGSPDAAPSHTETSPPPATNPTKTVPSTQQPLKPSGATKLAPKQPLPADTKPTQRVRALIVLKNQPGPRTNQAANLRQVDAVIARLKDSYSITVRHRFGLLMKGFSATVTAGDIPLIEQDKDVDHVTRLHFTKAASATTSIDKAKLADTLSAARTHAARHSAAAMKAAPQTSARSAVRSQPPSTTKLDGRGMLVAVIDTGVNIHHEAMKLDTDVTKEQMRIKTPISGFTDKVPYGYNFADANYDVVDSGTGNYHGHHVAGIIAGNSDKIKGVAPNAQIAALKVSSNVTGTMSDDAIFAAMEKAVDLKVDAVNMSLGRSDGFSDAPPWDVLHVIQNMTDNGVAVYISAGNSGMSTSLQGDLTPLMNKMDSGTVASNSTSPFAMSVGSFDSPTVHARTLKYRPGSSASPQTEVPYSLLEYNDACIGTELPAAMWDPTASHDSFNGKVVLVSQEDTSTLPFSTMEDLLKKGAKAVIKQTPPTEPSFKLGSKGTLCYGSLAYNSFNEIADKINEGTSMKLQLTTDMKSFTNPQGIQPSYFSSWGTSPELTFKPNISGIGGNVYSSTTGKNGYANMSGTSMSSPQLTGMGLIVEQRLGQGSPLPHMTSAEKVKSVNAALVNTADIKTDPDTHAPYSPRLMGAGLANLENALNTHVLATVDGEPSLSLRQVAPSSSKEFTVTLHNYDKTSRTFTPGKTCVTTDDINARDITVPTCAKDGAEIEVPSSSVTVPAGGTKTVNVTVKTGSKTKWIGGWVTFTSSDKANQSDLSVAFMGFVGDWNKEPIIAKPFIDKIHKTGPDDFDNAFHALFGTNWKTSNTHTGFIGGFNTDDPYFITAERPYISANVPDNSVLIPALLRYRNAYALEADVVDSKNKTVMTLRNTTSLRKTIPADINNFQKFLFNTYVPALIVSPEIWDPAQNKNISLPDGDYTLRIKARTSRSLTLTPWQDPIKLPFGVDSTKPTADAPTVSCPSANNCTVTVTATDKGSGIDKVSLKKASGDPAPVTVSGNTYTFTGLSLDDLSHITITDKAKNRTTVDLPAPSPTDVTITNARYLSGLINDKSMEDDINKPVVDNKTVTVRGIAGADVDEVDIKGTTQHRPATTGRWTFAITVPVDEGNVTLTVTATANGSTSTVATLKFTVDLTPPTFTNVSPGPTACIPVTAAEDQLALGAISGKVFDANLTKQLDVEGVTDKTHTVTVATDGKFTIPARRFHVKPDTQMIHLVASDGVNKTALPLAVCHQGKTVGPMLKDEDNWTLPPHLNTKFLNGSAAKKVGDAYELPISGAFWRKPSPFQIAVVPADKLPPENMTFPFEDITINDDLTWSHTIKLKPNTWTKVIYHIVDPEGIDTRDAAVDILIDDKVPTLTFEKDSLNPALNDDGTLYVRAKPGDKSQKLTIKGTVDDNLTGYRLAIDNDNVVNAINDIQRPIEPGKARQEFGPTDIPVNDGDVHKILVGDVVTNLYEYNIPVVFDTEKPTASIDGLPGGPGDQPRVSNKTQLAVNVEDAHLQSATVTLDGKQIDSKQVQMWLNPLAYKGPSPKPDTPAESQPQTALDFTVLLSGLTGAHTLTVHGVDKAGNDVTLTRTFFAYDPDDQGGGDQGGGSGGGDEGAQGGQSSHWGGAAHARHHRIGKRGLARTGTNPEPIAVAALLALALGGVLASRGTRRRIYRAQYRR